MIYLIDFGLASPYLNADGSHIQKQQLNKFSGNFLFASLNSCRGYSKSRRDDIESAFHMLIYLINNQSLPWSDFGTKYNTPNMKFSDFLLERLQKKYTRKLFQMIPNDLYDCLKKVLCLKFDQEPPYDYILKNLQNCFMKANRALTPQAPPSSMNVNQNFSAAAASQTN